MIYNIKNIQYWVDQNIPSFLKGKLKPSNIVIMCIYHHCPLLGVLILCFMNLSSLLVKNTFKKRMNIFASLIYVKIKPRCFKCYIPEL